MFIFYGQLPHNNVVILFMEIHHTIYILQFRIYSNLYSTLYSNVYYASVLRIIALSSSHVTRYKHASPCSWVDVFLGCYKLNWSATLISYRSLWKWEISLGLGFVQVIVGRYKENLCPLHKQIWHTYSSYALEMQLNWLSTTSSKTKSFKGVEIGVDVTSAFLWFLRLRKNL